VDKQAPKDAARSEASLREHLGKFGNSLFAPVDISLDLAQPWFAPASAINSLRRAAVEALEAARLDACERPPRAAPVEPPVAYPEDSLSYLANVYNSAARDFYARHGVRVIAAAYESHEEQGEVSLMITKHCVRYSLSLCPKQTRGVTGVHGTIKAEPLTLINGSEKLTLRFDCKPCEMHVVGRIKRSVVSARAQQAQATPMQFYRTRPAGAKAPR
jgi:putative protease